MDRRWMESEEILPFYSIITWTSSISSYVSGQHSIFNFESDYIEICRWFRFFLLVSAQFGVFQFPIQQLNFFLLSLTRLALQIICESGCGHWSLINIRKYDFFLN